jgi:DNA invertase Pin-like site-specific DNA recombinase
MPLYKKITVVIRYIVLGGHERGKGIGAAAQVARELKVSTSTVNRCLREAKSWRANRGVVLKMVEIYRRRYPGG